MAVAVRLKHIALKARASPLSRPERDPQRGNLDVGREAEIILRLRARGEALGLDPADVERIWREILRVRAR